VFLNDGSSTRISANIDYVTVPDLSLVKSSDLEFAWKVGEDPFDNDHLPIVLSVCKGYSTLGLLEWRLMIVECERMCLGHFDKKMLRD